MTEKYETGRDEKNVQMTLDNKVITGTEVRKGTISRKVFPETIFLDRKSKWEKLFNGFHKLVGVTYVTSPSFLLDLYSKYDFQEIELVIGHGLMDGFKSQLEGKESDINSLFSRVSDKTLKVYGTKATIHSKIYILSNDEVTRVIVGSPNLSYKAEGSRQREYAWYIDIHCDDYESLPFLQKMNNDYQKHHSESDIIRFMEDLEDLRANSENDRKEDFLIWAGTSNDEDGRKAIRGVIENVKKIALIHDPDAEDLIQIRIPESTKKEEKKFLTKKLDARIHKNGFATLSRKHFLDEISNLGMPRMEIDKQGAITLGLGGQLVRLPNEVTSQDLSRSLSDIESYIELVDKATCFHKDAVKMNMMEAILYTMAAPFSNEWMRKKRKVRSLTDRTGPKHLVIYGAAGNGKTTFGRLQNHLLSSKPIEPLDGKNWIKGDWDNLFDHVMTNGSPYPVVIDDIKSSCFTQQSGSLEGRIKAYFENDWTSNRVYPMMIFNTNHDNMADWAERRVRKLDFSLRFKGNEEEQSEVERILTTENLVFPAFAKIYSRKLNEGFEYSSDELKIAREALSEVYQNAQRELPSFFPTERPEEIYDMNAIYCNEIESYGTFQEKMIKTNRGRVLKLMFESNRYGKNKTLETYQSRLPPEVSTQIESTTLIIKNPDEYRKFMMRGRPEKMGFFSGLFR